MTGDENLVEIIFHPQEFPAEALASQERLRSPVAARPARPRPASSRGRCRLQHNRPAGIWRRRRW